MKDFDQEPAVPGTASSDGDATGQAALDPPDDQGFFNESLEFGLRSIGRLMERRKRD